MPSSSSVFVTVMGTMNSKDKYDMDSIYGQITEFSKYDSYNDWHEKQAYEGSNFLPLAGSLTMNIVLILVPGFLMMVAHILTRKFYRVEIMRRLGTRLEETDIIMGLMRLFYV